MINSHFYKDRGDSMAKLSEEEIKYRNELSEYLRKDIFGYEQRNYATPNYLWVRINGFITGKAFGNKELTDENKYYTYKDILCTFKYCKPEIMKLFNRMTFKDEHHRINTVMRIIDANLVVVKDMIRKAEEQQSQIENSEPTMAEQYEIAKIQEETEKDNDTYKTKSTQVDESLEEFF